MDTPADQPTSAPANKLIVHERNERHILTRLVHVVLKPFKPSLMKPGKLPPNATRLTASRRTKRLCDVVEDQVDGLWVYNITPKPAKEPTEKPDVAPNARRILYFAGGGWQMPPSKHHWAFCAELARRLPHTRVTIVSCPLAPKAPVSVAFPQMERAYGSLMAESARAGESVVVAGDSSGGNIALCLAAWALRFQEQQRQGSKPPAAVFVLSPTTDLRHEMEAIARVEGRDPIHTHQCIRETARTWCPEHGSGGDVGDDDDGHAPRQLPGDWTFEDPRVSPIQADLSYLVRHNVKVHGLTGSYDVLEPEAVVFRDKCRDEGVAGEWLAWDGQMHCFPLTFRYGIKESKEAMDWIVGVLAKH